MVPYPEIPYSEYKLRLEKAKEQMEKYNIDAYVLFDISNLRYFGGFVGGLEERAIIIPRDGMPVAIVVHDDKQSFDITSWIKDIRAYHYVWRSAPGELDNFHSLLISTIKDLGLNNKKLGMDYARMRSEVPYSEVETLKADLSNAKIIDATSAIMEQRMIKTEYEQKIIRDHNNKYTRAMRKAIPQLREGMTIGEWYTIVIKCFIDEGLGLDPTTGHFFSINSIGPGSLWNTWLYEKVLNPGIWKIRFKRGDMFYIDYGPMYKGQFIDVQRNICVGKTPSNVKRAYKGVLEAHLAAIDALAPGIKASEIKKIIVNTLKKYNLKLGMPCVGHGLPGPQYAEEPELEFKAGMFVTVETFVITSRYELFPEDNILITEDGHDAISLQLSPEIWEV